MIIDDHVAVRQGLQRILSAEFENVHIACAASSSEALDLLQQRVWSVVILDLGIPGRGGIDTIATIKDRSPSTRVLIYTMHPEGQLGVQCMRAGADGYLTKDKPVENIIEAVRKLASGSKYVGPELGEALATAIAVQGRSPIESLSDRERRVLLLLAEGGTPSEIAAELNLSIKTISTYRSRILDKLNLRSTADLIRFAIQNNMLA